MRKAGIIGGIAPESTIQYYRLIVQGWRERNPDGSYPPVVINSIDMTRMLALIGAGQLAEVTAFLLAEIRALERAGADFAVLASNTPHLVFAELQAVSGIPLLSIVEAARDAAVAAGLRRVALFGTRFTMQGRLYAESFQAADVAVLIPAPAEQDFIHDRYMDELVAGIFLPETRDRLVAIIRRLRAETGIDGVVLGGTELPLILPEPRYEGLPCLDTTRLHVARILDAMLAG